MTAGDPGGCCPAPRRPGESPRGNRHASDYQLLPQSTALVQDLLHEGASPNSRSSHL